MSKINKNSLLENLEIIDISTEGKAIAKHEGLVVFIEGAVPGDIVNARVYKSKSSFAEARLEKIVTLSPQRETPVCKHFGTCGGCKWQNLQYREQLRYKQKYVTDAFARIGKFEFPEPIPILGNSEPYYYRNKLEFSFSNKRWLTEKELQEAETITERNALGFHIPGLFDKVLNIETCYLQPEPSNSIRNFIREYAQRHNLTFFDIRSKSGFLRTLMIRSTLAGGLMVVLSVFEDRDEELKKLLEELKAAFPQISSLQYAVNKKGNDTLTDLEIITFRGSDHIVEEMEGLKFKISARSFYQTNPAQALELYKITRDFAGLSGGEIVYDLYTGTGTIANFVARGAKKVIGVDYVEDSIADARENSRFNGLTNTAFFAGDMKDVLNAEFLRAQGAPDIMICDPPRAGMHEDVISTILEANPSKVVYVSCNPSTQARDIALMEEKYFVKAFRPVDMFPQTAHVENVALLVRRP